MRQRVHCGVLLLVMLLLAACGSSIDGPQAGEAAGATTAATAAASPNTFGAVTMIAPAPTTGPTQLPTPGPDEFVNPVIAQDFPDPDIVHVGDAYFAYATGSAGQTFQAARSPDLVTWELLGDAMPSPPGWTKPGPFFWAPEVTTWDGGQTFLMYFTARDAASDKQCIGVAVSDKPEGPFTGVGDAALICQREVGGSIDASTFIDDGARYVLWKNDGNCCDYPVYLYIQKVSEDGLTLEGEPTQLITTDQVWEGAVVEAPTLWKHQGKYYLFYSANSYAGANYAIGWAVAAHPTGPFIKPNAQPLLQTDYKTGGAVGPGGQDVVVDDDGETWLAYHSWGPAGRMRRMMLDELVWEGATPLVEGPDRGPQPKP